MQRHNTELQTGHTVRIQPNGYRDQWRMAKVIKKVGIRSYLVRTPNGQVYRRNRKHLQFTTEAIDKMPQNSGTADQPADEAQPHEEPSNIDYNAQSNTAQEEQPGSAGLTQTVSRTGRVIKPSSRYNNYVKL